MKRVKILKSVGLIALLIVMMACGGGSSSNSDITFDTNSSNLGGATLSSTNDANQSEDHNGTEINSTMLGELSFNDIIGTISQTEDENISLSIPSGLTLTNPIEGIALDGTLPFISTWKTDNNGSSADNQIMIKTKGGGYNYTIKWGDGESDTGVTGDITHTYAAAGTYSIEISGAFPRIYFSYLIDDQGDDAQKLLSVDQWGDIPWHSMQFAFAGCANMVINATDRPNLSSVSSMVGMFLGAKKFNQNIENWDVSHVTDMSYLFAGATQYNQSINNWDTSHVTNMYGMFYFAEAYNQPINFIDVGNVTDMRMMFTKASAFNQGINAWDTSHVINMDMMFTYATEFNHDIGGWNTSQVISMFGMFAGAVHFDQDIGDWNIQNVKEMDAMFKEAGLSTDNYNKLLIGWSGQFVQDDVKFHGGKSTYRGSEAIAARETLISNYHWDITDGGEE